ncbi:hypothetical protein ACX80W_07085 [Arthrobacter sp. TMN-37]
MSGSFTVLPAVPSDALAPASVERGLPSMPGFHRNRRVRRTLRKLRQKGSALQRMQGPEAGSARDNADRFLLPQHFMYIR